VGDNQFTQAELQAGLATLTPVAGVLGGTLSLFGTCSSRGGRILSEGECVHIFSKAFPKGCDDIDILIYTIHIDGQ